MPPITAYDPDEMFLSAQACDTEAGWRHILGLCARRAHFGFGALDSFLSGPDLDNRIALVEAECRGNEWLRLELRDTLRLDQSCDWNDQQKRRLELAAL